MTPERALPGDLEGRAVQSSGKALFISLSNVGDAIMTTPALELLHARYPEHSIDVVADRRSGEIALVSVFSSNIRNEIL